MHIDAVWNNYLELGTAAYQTGNFELAEAMLTKATKQTHENFRPRTLAVVYENLALVFRKQNRYVRAEKSLKISLDMHKENRRPDCESVCRLMTKQIELYLLQERFSLAKSTFEQVTPLYEQIRDPNAIVPTLLTIALLWTQAGKHTDAMDVYNLISKLRRAATPSSDVCA